MPVPDRNVKFWRVVRPETARDAILAVPVTVRFVRASFTPVAFRYTTSTRFVLPVAVRFEVTRPPKRVTVVVADAPRWVTEARVSVSVVTDAGQFVPFERQTVVPPTKRDVRAREVPVAFVKFRVVTVVLAADKAPVRVRVVAVALIQVRSPSCERPEMERLVPVAPVKETLARVEVP